jgi:hypothetical protein
MSLYASKDTITEALHHKHSHIICRLSVHRIIGHHTRGINRTRIQELTNTSSGMSETISLPRRPEHNDPIATNVYRGTSSTNLATTRAWPRVGIFTSVDFQNTTQKFLLLHHNTPQFTPSRFWLQRHHLWPCHPQDL